MTAKYFTILVAIMIAACTAYAITLQVTGQPEAAAAFTKYAFGGIGVGVLLVILLPAPLR